MFFSIISPCGIVASEAHSLLFPFSLLTTIHSVLVLPCHHQCINTHRPPCWTAGNRGPVFPSIVCSFSLFLSALSASNQRTQRSHRSQPCFLVCFPFFYNAKKFLLGCLRDLAYPPAVTQVMPVYPPPCYAPLRVLLVRCDLGSIPLISSFPNSWRRLTVSATVPSVVANLWVALAQSFYLHILTTLSGSPSIQTGPGPYLVHQPPPQVLPSSSANGFELKDYGYGFGCGSGTVGTVSPLHKDCLLQNLWFDGICYNTIKCIISFQ